MDVEGSYGGHYCRAPDVCERNLKKTKRFSKEKCYFTSFQVSVRSRGMCEGSISYDL